MPHTKCVSYHRPRLETHLNTKTHGQIHVLLPYEWWKPPPHHAVPHKNPPILIHE